MAERPGCCAIWWVGWAITGCWRVLLLLIPPPSLMRWRGLGQAAWCLLERT